MNYHETIELMRKYDISPTRSLGQNFLIDDRVVQRMCDGASLNKSDCVVEIGPGLGTLTRALTVAGRVKAVEIDKKMVGVLKDSFQHHDNVDIIHADALRINLHDLVSDYPSVKVAANLPYYITTQLVEKLLVELANADVMMLMMQKEAADRLFALPTSKLYGPVSVLVSLTGNICKYIKVPASAYYPRPHVDSIVIRIDRSESVKESSFGKIAFGTSLRSISLAERRSFHEFLNKCFSQRRKVLTNVLRNTGYENAVKTEQFQKFISVAELSSAARAEEIPPQLLLELFQIVSSE